MSEKKQDEQKQRAEEKPFVEILEDAKEQVVEEFYKESLTIAEETIKSLQHQVADLHEQELLFRDEVALRCYTTLIEVNRDYPQAAKDSYTAADAFMRYRENESQVEHVITVNKNEDHA